MDLTPKWKSSSWKATDVAKTSTTVTPDLSWTAAHVTPSGYDTKAGHAVARIIKTEETLTGGKLSGNHYYRVVVDEPMSPEVEPYTAECADIIEALGMTFNEGEAFKALWRLAAARRGRGKPGNKAQYDADKVAHYGARVAAQTKKDTE